jgi:hypothetical protein
MSEGKDLLKKLNKRIHNLEKKQAEANRPLNQGYYQSPWPRQIYNRFGGRG